MISKLTRKFFASVTALSMALTPVFSQACTSFLLKANDGGYVYGRTMEFGIPLKSALIVMPRNLQYEGIGVNGKPGTGLNWKTRYAATGANAFGMPILVDGMKLVWSADCLMLRIPLSIKTPQLPSPKKALHLIKC